jgi:hypothetical protein
MADQQGRKPYDHGSHAFVKAQHQPGRRHELDIPAAHAAPNQGGD